ncbi:MAG: O-antigen ligase family protein [Patescibacteria group bacterium]
MDPLARNKIVLSLAILALATIAVFAPNLVFAGALGIIFIILTFHFPAIGIAAAILAAVASEFGRIEFGGFSFLLLDLIALVTFLIWLAGKLIHKEKIRLDGVTSGLLIFWAVGILSLVFGSAELSSGELKFAAFYFLRFIGISGLLLVVRDLKKKESLRVGNFLLGGGFLLALLGFVLLKILPDFTEAGLTDLGWDPHIGRLTSTFLDPNFAAGAFAFFLAILGGRFLQAKKFGAQVWLLVVAGILGSALLLTFSRSGILALGISGLVLGIWGDRRILLAGILIAALGIASSARLAERIGELGKSVESLGSQSQQVLDPTAQLRADSWREGWRIFESKPILGVGLGAYKFHQSFAGESSHAATGSDASLLNIAAMTGILGLVAFGIFLWNLGATAWRHKNWGFLAAMAGLLAHSVFVNSLFFPPLALIFFVSAGLAIRD